MDDESLFRIIKSFELPTGRLATVAWLDPFAGQWARLSLTEDDANILELTLVRDPILGDVVSGTNGVRKVRFAAPSSNQGKRGAYRAYYLNALEYGYIVLLAILSKNERADLSKDDRNLIGRRVAFLKKLMEEGKIR